MAFALFLLLISHSAFADTATYCLQTGALLADPEVEKLSPVDQVRLGVFKDLVQREADLAQQKKLARELLPLAPNSVFEIASAPQATVALKRDLAQASFEWIFHSQESKPGAPVVTRHFGPSPRHLRRLERLGLSTENLVEAFERVSGVAALTGRGSSMDEFVKWFDALGVDSAQAVRMTLAAYSWQPFRNYETFGSLLHPALAKWNRTRSPEQAREFRELFLRSREHGAISRNLTAEDFQLLEYPTEELRTLVHGRLGLAQLEQLVHALDQRGVMNGKEFDSIFATHKKMPGIWALLGQAEKKGWIRHWRYETHGDLLRQSSLVPYDYIGHQPIPHHFTTGERRELARAAFLNGLQWAKEFLPNNPNYFAHGKDALLTQEELNTLLWRAAAKDLSRDFTAVDLPKENLRDLIRRYPSQFYPLWKQASRFSYPELAELYGHVGDEGGAKPEPLGWNAVGLRALDAQPAYFRPQEMLVDYAPQLRKHGVEPGPAMPADQLKKALGLLEEGKLGNLHRPTPGTTRLVFDRVQDSDVARDLLRALAMDHGLPPENLPEDSLDILAQHVGIDPSWKRSKALTQKTQGLRDLYSLLLKTRRYVGLPLFQGLEIDAKVYEPANFEKFLDVLEAMQSITVLSNRGSILSPPEEWQQVKTLLGFPQRLTAADVTRMHTGSLKLLTERLQPFFGEAMPKITFSVLNQMESHFGPLDSAFHLMGRLESEGRREGLKDMAKIFQANLEGRFADLKYRGYLDTPEDAERQLASLPSEDRRAAWERNHSDVRFHHQAEGENTLAGLRETLRNTVAVQLKNNLPNLPEVTPDQVANVRQILGTNQGHPERQKLLRDLWKNKSPEEADKLTLAAVREALATFTDPLEASRFVKRYLPLAKNENLTAYRLPDDAVRDLQTLALLEQQARKIEEGDFLLATATTDEPRLLMLHGCLVSDSSCQDTRSGHFFYTALSPVKDAHVKLLLGAGLQRRDFAKSELFDSVQKALSAGHAVDARIVGKNASWEFTWTEGGKIQTVQSLPLPLFGRRHLMKLGGVSEVPGDGAAIALERAYNTSTAPIEPLATQAREVLRRVAEATGAKTGVDTYVPATRAGEGAYSDAAGGRKSEAYVIPASHSLGGVQ